MKTISKYSLPKVLVLVFCCTFQVLNAQKSEWAQLFNGEDLTGWEQLNGKAEYFAEDGAIVGVTRMNTPNSFLCTTAHYSDFILEFEVLVDPLVNSGVQFRSNSVQSYRNGVVHGYQFELDPLKRAYTGGIYDEGRRAWLYPLSLNDEGRKAFQNGIWNRCRVEAIGNTIRTWVNGVQCANLVDDLTAEGFIGLQVHSIGNKDHEGRMIKWRNIRIKTSNLEASRWPVDPAVREMSYLVNTLTPHEKRNGWRLLFDGKSTQGWRSGNTAHFPDRGWRIEDSQFITDQGDGGQSINGGDIITIEKFRNFELELEFKIYKGGNSGIKYFVDAELEKGNASEIGLEYQLIDDENHKDASEGLNGNRQLGALYDLIPADNLSIPGRGKQFKGLGRWNKARILVKDGHVEHWLNNEMTLTYDRFSPAFKALVAYSKYKNWTDFGQWPEGHILLQEHGHVIHFRSIKVREFN